MRVLIDADGCPVIDIAIRCCEKERIQCILLCDTSHEFQKTGADTLVFDKGSDSVDFAIANRIQKDDLVITQDYGLASMCLGRCAAVLHQDGWEYTADNIDALLLFRHESKKQRTATGRFRGPKKRTVNQDAAFEEGLQNCIARLKR